MKLLFSILISLLSLLKIGYAQTPIQRVSEAEILQAIQTVDKTVLQSQVAVLANEETVWKMQQYGVNNSIDVQTNQPNTLDFLQNGDRNTIETSIEGQGNLFKFEQYGNDNLLQMLNVKSSNTYLEITQLGNGNQLLDNGYSMTIPIRIEQRGGMKIEITSILPSF